MFWFSTGNVCTLYIYIYICIYKQVMEYYVHNNFEQCYFIILLFGLLQCFNDI